MTKNKTFAFFVFFFKIKCEGNLTNWLGGFDKMKDKTYDNKYVNNVLAIIGDNIRKAVEVLEKETKGD